MKEEEIIIIPQPIAISIVVANGYKNNVVFGVFTERAKAPLLELLEFMSYQSTYNDYIFESVLIQSLIDPYAFSQIINNSQLRSYLHKRSSTMDFKYRYDTYTDSYKIIWNRNLICSPTKIGPCIIKNIYSIFLARNV